MTIMSDEKNPTATSDIGADPPGEITIPVTTIQPYPTIKKGSRGPTVAKWQRMIGVDADGNFGSMTDAVTRQWQKDHGLAGDGVVGVATWAKALENTSPTGMLALEWNQPSPEIPSAPAPATVIPPVAGAMPITGSLLPPPGSKPADGFKTTAKATEATLMGSIDKLPWWAKLLALLGVGYGVYAASNESKGRRHG